MKFYTKEWYHLMQRQHYTSGLQMIPDKIYSDQEIQAFYDADLAKELEHDQKFYAAHSTQPFDPAETIACFRDCYKNMVRYGSLHYPAWVRDTVDKRLLALQRIPETAYQRLKKEEAANQQAFEQIMSEAEKVLSKQDIPEEIRSQFHFHDASLLSLKRIGSDIELYLRKDGGWPEGTSPYCKILFQDVTRYDREKGFALRPKIKEDGEISSSCQYLYQELYRTSEGYEVHLLLWTKKALRYLTVACKALSITDNI